ncbi:MAG TPA: hypothetical protein VF914_19525 [Chloroflexia bacterium]|jgi:hypothetical protein
MDAASIQTVLEAGKIGEMPFSEWVEQMGKAFALDAPGWMGRPVATSLSALGATAVRWEPGDSNPDEQRLWQAYLVVTLPASASAPGPSLKLIHDIAVESCGSYFYTLRAGEVWIEYLLARREVRDAIELALEGGRIGELPFPKWFRYHPASTNIKIMAQALAARGVTAVRWEEDENERRWGINWQAYLVVTLPKSSSVSPPSLPSERLVREVAVILRQTEHYFTRVTASAVEVWLSYSIKLPLEDAPGELIEENGITYISFDTPKARRASARARRRALWQALVSFLRRS